MTIRTIPAGVTALSIAAAPLAAWAKPPATKGGNPHVATRPATGPKSTAKAPRTTTTQTAPHGNPHTKSATTTTGTTSKPAAVTTTTATTPPNPIAQKISSKPNLSTKVQAMLPQGMTLDQASLGFKNQGQFIAALHVSQNLGIPFADLKTAMTGINPTLPPMRSRRQPRR